MKSFIETCLTLSLAALPLGCMVATESAEDESATTAEALTEEIVTPEVLATGLNSPRGLAVDARGRIYVAEAGVGGPGPCHAEANGEGCYGESGSITRIEKGTATRIVTGLPSLSNAAGTSTLGVHDVVIKGQKLYAVTGLGTNPAVREGDGWLAEVSPKLGYVLEIRRQGHDAYTVTPVADVSGFEATNNPHPDHLETNPFGLLADGSGWIVADAAGNDLLRVSRTGEVSLLAVLPGTTAEAPPPLPPGPMPVESVPTAVVRGPDGALYVGELTGYPFPNGGSRVLRVAPCGEISVYAEGFTNVMDLAFDRRGNLLVLEFSSNGLLSGNPSGALVRLDQEGEREIITSDLIAPTAVAVGPRNELYVSNCGACGHGQGSVLRVR